MLLSLCFSAGALAVGLGELRGQPVLGERLAIGIELLGSGRLVPEASCFRIVPPADGDLPWLKKAALAVRPGNPAILEIRSDSPLAEPIVRLAVELGCGHDISRIYVLLASPAAEGSRAAVPVAPPAMVVEPLGERPPARAAVPVAAVPPPAIPATRKAMLPRPAALPADRLMLSGGAGSEDVALRLATEFAIRDEQVKEARRDLLRLEFRMLMAMNEQAATQLAAAEKLREMEATLGELRQQAATFARNVEKGGGAPAGNAPPPAPAESPRPVPAGGLSEWSLYGALLGVLLGVGGWLGWQNYRQQRQRPAPSRPEFEDLPGVAPVTGAGRAAVSALDLPLETALDAPTHVDFELDGGGSATVGATAGALPEVAPVFETVPPEAPGEASPIMELAEIMLSFGRVKGAAQTLQEYIDNNPQDALQPWVRLMDVYRMAGMRDEFENVARNLNRHFNVEVQTWEAAEAAGLPEGGPPVRPQSLEEMPRLMGKVVELWNTGDVVGYLYQLLRDNRGGERVGFAMAVVDDILFLIELKETANRME